MKRFYTYPESFHNWPYLLVPFHIWKVLLRRDFRHAIVDTGVEIFAHGAKDYPKGFYDRYIVRAKQLSRLFEGKIWFVIPDYPDDYVNNPIEDNVEKTLRNIEMFYKVDGVNWVFPLQADYMDLESFRYSCREVRKYNPARVAIGTVCKTRNIEFIEKCCRMARRFFPNQWIHAFGPTLRALPRIIMYIDSWDSCAYFCSRETHGFMCRNKQQRKQYFEEYLKRVNQILKQVTKQAQLRGLKDK